MTLVECFENKGFCMKYIRKYLSAEILLTRECRSPKARFDRYKHVETFWIWYL